MMNRRSLLLVSTSLAVVGLLIWLTLWYQATAAVRILVDERSSITNGLVVTINNEKKVHKLPYRARLKPGDYAILAWGNGAAAQSQSIVVEKGKTNEYHLLFRDSSGEEFLRLYRGDPSSSTIPFANLFPHETIDYLITAEDNNTEITKITVLIKHRFTSPSDPADYAQERDFLAKAARDWLEQEGIPSSIPVSITDY